MYVPDFVDTAMAKGEGLFWITPLDKAVQQIYRASFEEEKLRMFRRDGNT